MEEFRWAYVGCGNIAGKTAKAIVKGPHRVTAVFGRNFKKAKEFAASFGAEAFETFDALLESDCYDGLYIATPHTAHVSYSIRALQAGKPVLCEKPVGVCENDALLLKKTAEETGVYFCEAMWTWFSDLPYGVKKWIDEGQIGKVKHVSIDYAFPGLLKRKTSRVRMPETAGGALLDIGIYPITYCYRLFGYPQRISCNGTIQDGIDVTETVELEYDGFTCSLFMSLSGLKEGCKIVGTQGEIHIPLFHMASYATLHADRVKQTIQGKTDYLTEFSRAADEIRSGCVQSAYVPHQATIDCLRIMDVCRAQMRLVYPFEK